MAFVLFCFISNIIYGAIPAEERSVLIALYNSTTGDSWVLNSGWKTPPLHTDGFAVPGTEGSWFGIRLQEDHVTVIDLDDNNLYGPLPPELGNLSHLQTLSFFGYTQQWPKFSTNHLTGSIPSSLGNLSHLQTLILGYNQLSGTIPPELGNLSNLVSLNLSGNLFSGSIPPELGNLGNLKSLLLSSTPLTGSIPSSLGNLSNLQALILGYNQLSGSIPASFGKLGNLVSLLLSGNPLSGSIPPEFGNLGNLCYLWLGNTRISGSIPDSFGNLGNLKEVHLDYTKLSGSIPASFGNLGNLSYLHLSNTQLSGSIPASFGNLGKLIDAHLNNNQLSGHIPPELGKLSNLHNLGLDYNRLSGSIPLELGNLYKINYLNLDHNQLSGIIPSCFGYLSDLQGLYLSNNQLSGSIPPELGNLKKLRSLEFNDNQLSGNIPASLGNLDLYNLQMDHNYLRGEIPSGFTNLDSYITFDIGYNCLHASNSTLRAWLDSHDPDWEAHQNQCGINGAPFINLNRTQLNFCAVISLTVTVTDNQEVWITNGGGGVLKWTTVSDASWLSCAPESGTGNGSIFVSIDSTGLAEGTYAGNITITDPNAVNSPRTVSIALKVKSASRETPPFGDFSTPIDGSIVSGSIPITGWALDDVTVQDVKIYQGDENSLVYIGDAVFVEGARPDIEAAYPDYPSNYKAGWGYMLLTNYFPHGGNGDYRLHAVATDINGNRVDLGMKTITVDNANAVKPFGYIDTPLQGGVVSGKHFVNFGWALTPPPNYIPTDGSTIDVWIDGVKRGHPIYNNYREDIAAIFPNYANSNGAVGYFYLDAAAYETGIHTIAWTVLDSAGNSDGIGSRYFSIQNAGNDKSCRGSAAFSPCSPVFDLYSPVIDRFGAVGVIKGYREDAAAAPQTVYPDENGIIAFEIKELERLEIQFSPGVANVSPLPIGSTLDTDRGIFYWQPGPGFIGQYRFVFIEKEETGPVNRKEIAVTIVPKFPGKENRE